MEIIDGGTDAAYGNDLIFYNPSKAKFMMANLLDANTKIINLVEQHGALLVFPEKPHFGSWLKQEELRVIHQQIATVQGRLPPTILVNWSSNPNRFGFFVERSPEGVPLTHLPVFKYLRDIMPSTTLRTGHIVVDSHLDVIAFKLRHFCKDEA